MCSVGFNKQEQQEIIRLLGEEPLFLVEYTYRENQEKCADIPQGKMRVSGVIFQNEREINGWSRFCFTCIGERQELEGAHQGLKSIFWGCGQ